MVKIPEGKNNMWIILASLFILLIAVFLAWAAERKSGNK